MTTRLRIMLLTFLATSVVVTTVSDAHAEGPVKLVPVSHIGWEVNKTTKGNLCTVSSGDECQTGTGSNKAGGFEYPESLTSGPEGDIYVADKGNARVEKLTPAGEFVLMFGEEVNETKDDTPGATEAEKNLCTEEEIKAAEIKCKSGLEGSTTGAIYNPQSLAVEPATGNIYVLDYSNWRVDEYEPDGRFVLMIGREVNETKDDTPGATEAEKNVCTEEEITGSGIKCKAGVQGNANGSEEGAFDFEEYQGDLLGIGGASNQLLYVGDHQRIQEFDAKGEWKGEIKVGGAVTALAIDAQSNTAYVVYGEKPVLHEFDTSTGTELPQSIEIGQEFVIHGIAVDSVGHLAVTATDASSFNSLPFGDLYDASSGHLVTKFSIPDPAESQDTKGVTFDAKGELYIALETNEIVGYAAVPVAELVTNVATCASGVANGTSRTYDCLLGGEVNPYNVPDTRSWFEWGKTCGLGTATKKESVATSEAQISVSAMLENLRPNETFCFRLAGEDENVSFPEQLTAANTASFTTLAVPPVMVGEPRPSFVAPSSAVLYGELNPEDSLTEYYFEYATEPNAAKELAACQDARHETCVGVGVTSAGESAVYGKIGATIEVNQLQPSTSYRYRLKAIGREGTDIGLKLSGDEGQITTLSAPNLEAFTGPATGITTSSAIAQGTVNAGGQQATYVFELGVYRGAATGYSVVSSGSTEASAMAEPESTMLLGLQPGTEYAYRIALHSGYGTAVGAPVVFMTEPLLINLPVSITPVQLPVPKISFPKPALVPCKRGYTRDKRGLCVKTKAKNKGRRSKGPVKKRK